MILKSNHRSKYKWPVLKDERQTAFFVLADNSITGRKWVIACYSCTTEQAVAMKSKA
jgi:hypothetical protein